MITQDMPILHLTGTPRENGRTHGESLRPQIAEILSLWRQTTPLPEGLTFAEAIEIFLEETRFVAQVQRYSPDLLDEIAGLAEGANVAPDIMLAFQFGDEARWFFRDRFAAPEARGDRCSSIGARGENGAATIVAENVDVGAWADGKQTVLRIAGSNGGAETLVFTVAGMVAMNGVSGNGVAICCNTLLQLDPSPEGLPVAAVVRRALASASFEEALDFVRSVRHASGQNYLLGGRGAIANLECCGAGVAEYRLDARRDRVIHTNHPLANGATGGYDRRLEQGGEDDNESLRQNSAERLDCLRRRFGEASGAASLEDVKAVLRARDHALYPVCRERDRDNGPFAWMTIGSTIFELGEAVAMHAAAGPPSVCDYVRLEAAPA